MNLGDYARLVSLAAIWGASFIFTRQAAPEFGAMPTAGVRLLLAAAILLVYFRVINFGLDWRLHWRHYLVIGVINSAVPFALYAYAALHLPGSYLAIFNATSTLFGAVCAAIWLSERFTLRRGAGLFLGIGGVALVAGAGGADTGGMFWVAVLACLGAAACYGMGSTYARLKASHIDPRGVAASSQLVAGFAILPLFSIDPPATDIGAVTAVNLLALAVLCSAVAYLLYYRLIADVGPSKALTVTFLIPAFAMLWGALFLAEAITLPMIAGAVIVIAGTLIVATAPSQPIVRATTATPVQRGPGSA